MVYIVFLLIIIFTLFVFVYFDWDGGTFVVISIIMCIAFMLWNNKINVTPEIDAQRALKQIADEMPATTKVPMADGCVLYHYYGNGRSNLYTTKFVRCENSEVTTEKKYSCGKNITCTEQNVVKDN